MEGRTVEIGFVDEFSAAEPPGLARCAEYADERRRLNAGLPAGPLRSDQEQTKAAGLACLLDEASRMGEAGCVTVI